MTQTAATHLLELDHISLSFKGVKAVTDISFRVATGGDLRLDRPQRRRQEFAAECHQRRVSGPGGAYPF